LAHCTDAAGKEHVIGLENIYRRARRTPREEWPELIAEFLRMANSAAHSENLPADLASVAGQLMPRLGPPVQLGSSEAKVWHHPLADTNLGVSLVIDYPDRMCYVTDQLVADSGRTGDEWLATACANLLARTPAGCFQQIHEESGLCTCGVADAYDSSRALILDELLPETRSAGYLVVIPGRDELLVLPVAPRALPHIHLLKTLAERNYGSAPYPISDEVYWVHEGGWHRFPIDIRSEEVSVVPPSGFVEVLSRMTPPEAK
jgi:hypothetical protein